jgi:hypothetical protein
MAKLFLACLEEIEVAVWAKDEDDAQYKALKAIEQDLSSSDISVSECTTIPLGWSRNDYPHGDSGDDETHELTIGDLVDAIQKEKKQKAFLAKEPSLFAGQEKDAGVDQR